MPESWRNEGKTDWKPSSNLGCEPHSAICRDVIPAA